MSDDPILVEDEQILGESFQLVKARALRQCLPILATLDLERLQDQTLAVLARVTDAQGAAMWIADDRGQLGLRGYRGLVERGAFAPYIDPVDGDLGAAIRSGLPFRAPDAPEGEALYLPMLADGEPVALALLTDRASGRFGAKQQAAAQAVAELTAIAVKNARRYQAIERVGLRDKETQAYNLAYFVDYAAKEFYKARRYGRQFSLVVLSVDNLEQMRREVGRELFRASVRDVVGAASRVVRDADVIAKASDDEYYLLLPETDYFGALMLLRRAADEIRSEQSIRLVEERCPVLLSMGAATFPKDGEDFDELLHACRRHVEEQRGSLLRRLHLGDLEPADFWELVETLLEGAAYLPESSPSARLGPEPALFAAVQREAAREIARDPRARGVLYVGVRDPADGAPVLASLPSADASARAGDGAVRVTVLGPRGPRGDRAEPVHPLVVHVYLDGDQRLATHEFLLFLSENGAYALLQGADGRIFHTADVPLVDALVSKLQTHYDLQPI